MSYICLKYHLVFSTKDRRPLLSAAIMPRLSPYIGGIIREIGGSMLAANGPADHIHVAAVLDQKLPLMEALNIIKANSSKWIHQNFSELADFAWQEGYAAFSVSHSATNQVVGYVQRQLEHHAKMDFQQELRTLLDRHGIEYDERYLWK
jgi:REP element-mobilizing transposase RayT